jgi:hypothetical protein
MKIITYIICVFYASMTIAQGDCNFRINESDEETHISKRMLEFETWFSSNDEELKSNVEGDNVIGEVSMGDLSGSKILNLKIIVMSTKSQKYFGQIGVKAPLRMIM